MADQSQASVAYGVFNETSEHEKRVALTPEIVTRLKKSGVRCLIEKGAGDAALFSDEDYEKAGAQVVDRQAVIDGAQAFGFVDRPDAALIDALPKGSWVIGMLGSFTDQAYVDSLQAHGLVAVAIEKLPRQLSSAQSMDEMTSQNSVMGYKAALVAANAYGSFFPMMTTAAGTIRPAKVLVLGAGIAGLQAIATARRLGAVVTAYDVRPASKNEVLSLGAKFLDPAQVALETASTWASTSRRDRAKAAMRAPSPPRSRRSSRRRLTPRPRASTSSSPQPRCRAASPRCC